MGITIYDTFFVHTIVFACAVPFFYFLLEENPVKRTKHPHFHGFSWEYSRQSECYHNFVQANRENFFSKSNNLISSLVQFCL